MRLTPTPTLRTLLALAPLALAAACSVDVDNKGDGDIGDGDDGVDDGDDGVDGDDGDDGEDPDPQAQVAGLMAGGTATPASTVQVLDVRDDGTTVLVGEADIAADGSFSVDVEPDLELLVVRAHDEAGDLVSSAILERTGEADGAVTVTPLSAESTAEAMIWMEMVQRTGDEREANPVDVRDRVDAAVAATVAVAMNEGPVNAQVDALASGILAAQQAELLAWSEAGVETTQAALLDHELGASIALSESLHAVIEDGGTLLDEAAMLSEQVFEDALLQVTVDKLGLSAHQSAGAEAQASMAMRLTLDELFQGAVGVEGRVIGEAAAMEAGEDEAEATALATRALLADASDPVQQLADLATGDLLSATESALSVSEVVLAFDAWQDAVVGSTTVAGGTLLDAWLGLSGSGVLTADAVIDQSVAAAEALDVAARAGVATAVDDQTGAVDPQLAARAVVDAYADYTAAVHDATASLSGLMSEEDRRTTAALLVEATGRYRAVKAP